MNTISGVVTKYVYGLGLIGEETNGTFKTYHFDYRGSTVAITDASGTVTDTFQYDTYGKLLSRTGTSEVIFGYNGRDGVVTDENGFIYMRARYYSPELRRFVNADIVRGDISNAVTLNRYAYANGNPVSNVDPFGLSSDRMQGTFFEEFIDFFKNDTHKIYGNFTKGLLFGSGSVSGGNSEFGHSLEGGTSIYPKDKTSGLNGFLGALADFSVANANGEIGIGNENISVVLTGDADLLTAYAKAGIQYDNGFGGNAGAGASVVAAGISAKIHIFGVEVVIGLSGDILTAEASAKAGIVKEKGKTKMTFDKDIGLGWFGYGIDCNVILPF